MTAGTTREFPVRALVEQAEAGWRDGVVDRGQFGDEFGEVAGEDVLGNKDGVAVSIVGGALHHEHGGIRGDIEQFGIGGVDESGADSLSRTADVDGEQLVEAGTLHVSQRKRRTEVVGTPHGHPCKRLAVGEIQPSSFQHTFTEKWGDVRRRFDELEVEHLAFRGAT